MKKIKKIKDEVFYKEYKPQINHIIRAETNILIKDEDVCSFGGTMYETYREEEAYILKMAQDEKTKKRVWTILDVDGKLIISAGFHYVNRFGYIITEKEWETGEEEVENDD
ncbi:MAG TPA: hypothetical protein VIH28_07010 [Ignavibacteriaceae bacterium]